MQKLSICLNAGMSYAETICMGGGIDKDLSNIKYLIQKISAPASLLEGIAMLERDKLVAFLSFLPPEVLTVTLAKLEQGDEVPSDSQSPEFRAWVARHRVLEGLSQSGLARVLGIRPEQISRFETGKFPLSEKHVAKLKARFSPS